VTRDSGVQRWAWSAVSMNRLGPTLALRFSQPLGPGDHLEVPESAFLSPAVFDDFCLLIQRRLWEAEREAFTSRRA
jgi:hypothetical protein